MTNLEKTQKLATSLSLINIFPVAESTLTSVNTQIRKQIAQPMHIEKCRGK